MKFSIQAFLIIIFIGYSFMFSACVNDQKFDNRKTEKLVSPKEENIPAKANQKTKPKNKKKKNALATNVQKSDTTSLSKSNKKTSTTNKAAPAKPKIKKPSSKNIVANSTLSDKERLKALQTFDRRTINQDDYLVLKSLVQNEKEAIKIRQEALKKIYKPCGGDEEMLDYLFSVLQSKNNHLKKEVLYALQTIKYSSTLFQKKQSTFLNALKTGLYNTTDKKTYRMLFEALANTNDPAAHEIAIDFLKQEDFSKLSQKQLFQLLQKNAHPPHYPMMHRIMQSAKNLEIKTQLIPLLIKHPNSKAQFIKYLGDKNEEIKTRLTCADVLMKDNKLSFYTFTKNIVWDKEDNIELRRKCLSLINEVDLKTLEKYVSLYDDMLNIGISDNTLNQLRETLLKKINKNQY